MTQGEGQLIASRLVDKGLIPWDGREFDPAELESLSERELKVLRDIMLCEVESARASANALLKLSSGAPMLTRFKVWLWARFKVGLWSHGLSVRLFSAKLKAKLRAK
jgi:hypothetical protein